MTRTTTRMLAQNGGSLTRNETSQVEAIRLELVREPASHDAAGPSPSLQEDPEGWNTALQRCMEASLGCRPPADVIQLALVAIGNGVGHTRRSRA